MSFYIYDIIFLVIFILALVVFFFKKRKNFKWEGILLLYRTQMGVKLIDRISNKYRKTIGWGRYVVIAFGIVLMVFGTYLIFQLAYVFIRYPAFVKAVKIPPLMPLVPYLPSIFKLDFLPDFYFTYWIIAIACIAIFHEAAHGIFARYAKIKVKSTGFGFLGPFLAAFVEPDEKQMQKKDNFNQIAILGAGSFANLALTIIFFAILILFFLAAFAQSGVTFNTYTYSYINSSSIDSINGRVISGNLSLFGDINSTYLNITSNGKIYHVLVSNITEFKNLELVKAYEDTPAFNSHIEGIIVGLNDAKITNYDNLKLELQKYKPGDNVIIKTYNGSINKQYNITLAENPIKQGEPYLGIGLEIAQRTGVMGKFYSFLGSFRQQGVYYAPRFDGDFIIFIYNLIWWLVIINISVALFNMIPVGIFDGGRFFYLIVLSITKSKKFAEFSFKFMTYLFLLVFVLLMVFWGIGFFR